MRVAAPRLATSEWRSIGRLRRRSFRAGRRAPRWEIGRASASRGGRALRPDAPGRRRGFSPGLSPRRFVHCVSMILPQVHLRNGDVLCGENGGASLPLPTVS